MFSGGKPAKTYEDVELDEDWPPLLRRSDPRFYDVFGTPDDELDEHEAAKFVIGYVPPTTEERAMMAMIGGGA